MSAGGQSALSPDAGDDRDLGGVEALIDQIGEQSFPASDPPAWGVVRARLDLARKAYAHWEGFVAESGKDDVQYPANHVVAIFDSSDQTSCALDALLGGGFLESEVDLTRGPEDAGRLAQGTGRRGLQDWFIRLTGSVGLKNAETEMKERYEQALRENRSVIAVLVPTEERKDLAVGVLRRCGARFINFFGQLSVERIVG